MNILCNCACWVSSNFISCTFRMRKLNHCSLSRSAPSSSPLQALLPLPRPTHRAVHSGNTILPCPPPGSSPVGTCKSGHLSSPGPLPKPGWSASPLQTQPSPHSLSPGDRCPVGNRGSSVWHPWADTHTPCRGPHASALQHGARGPTAHSPHKALSGTWEGRCGCGLLVVEGARSKPALPNLLE